MTLDEIDESDLPQYSSLSIDCLKEVAKYNTNRYSPVLGRIWQPRGALPGEMETYPQTILLNLTLLI